MVEGNVEDVGSEMKSKVPKEWQYTPPECFVVGDGPYASALAFVLGTVCVASDEIKIGPPKSRSGGFSLVFDVLKFAVLVVPATMSAPDALRCHQHMWEWIEKLSSEGDQHEIAFLFILPPNASLAYEEALAIGLSVPEIDPETSGHGVWRRSGALGELIELIARVRPLDAVPIRARRASDARHIALSELRNALAQEDPISTRSAAKAVLAAFREQGYHLDLFCRPPCHQYGNLLRDWLSRSAAADPTPEEWSEERMRINTWLAPRL